MRWPWQHREVEYEIQPRDIYWFGYESPIPLQDRWEPFGVTDIPNTLNHNLVRLWLRRPVKHRKQAEYLVKVQSAGWGGHEVFLHLSELWVPFAVSDSYDNHVIWFKKKVDE